MSQVIGKNDAFIKRILPNRMIYDYYRLMWDTAWKGDQAIRMATFHHLMERGFVPRQAGQMTALFHGDYARMSPQARTLANKIWFTPTFKYVMGRAQIQMAKKFAKVCREGLRMKGTGNIAAADALLAKGFLGLIGTLIAKDLFLKYIMGFDVDATGLRYTKQIDTDQGKRELVLHLADPNNVILRLVHRWSDWGGDPDHMAEFFDKVKWELHPLWSLGLELLKGVGRDGRAIYNPYDSDTRKAADISFYGLRRIINVFDAIYRTARPSDKEATNSFNVLRKEVNKVLVPFLYVASFHYVRGTKSQRKRREIRKLISTYRSITTWRDKPKNREEYLRRVKSFREQLQERYDELRRLEREGQ
ncbi:MAG: hypothetical protein GTO54_11540 [Nitrososphaeria archaeon]|nr:hypothetical protein [Nitrososphaeria archaeon]